jgi:flagellar hook-basal body complex protein FliE
MTKIDGFSLKDVLSKIQESKESIQNVKPASEPSKDGASFLDHLQNSIGEVNKMQIDADKMSVDVATGKSGNLHEAMLAMSQAQLGFNFLVQVRNKALDAYNEVMRMQV